MFVSLAKKPENLKEHIVIAEEKVFLGEQCTCVRFDPKELDKYEVDGPNFAYLPMDFSNGTIEVDLAADLEENAPEFARGFIGLAFRISENLSAFEGMYIRPLNGRCDDQVRRNHCTQYFSFPEYKFDRLRAEEPEKYESYCDMQLKTWIHIKIEVQGSCAYLYVGNAEQPVLIVNDLKLGEKAQGGIGLWIDNGTLAYFRNLQITQK